MIVPYYVKHYHMRYHFYLMSGCFLQQHLEPVDCLSHFKQTYQSSCDTLLILHSSANGLELQIETNKNKSQHVHVLYLIQVSVHN